MTDWLAVGIALAAFLVAIVSYAASNAAVRAQVFLELRKRFSELKDSIPPWYDQPAVPADATAEQLRACELYWQNAFDEWFITTRLERRQLRKLWRRFYAGTLTRSLKNGALREIAARLTHGSTEFGDYREEFRIVLNELCLRAYKVPLCGDMRCKHCSANARFPTAAA